METDDFSYYGVLKTLWNLEKSSGRYDFEDNCITLQDVYLFFFRKNEDEFVQNENVYFESKDI